MLRVNPEVFPVFFLLLPIHNIGCQISGYCWAKNGLLNTVKTLSNIKNRIRMQSFKKCFAGKCQLKVHCRRGRSQLSVVLMFKNVYHDGNRSANHRRIIYSALAARSTIRTMLVHCMDFCTCNIHWKQLLRFPLKALPMEFALCEANPPHFKSS